MVKAASDDGMNVRRILGLFGLTLRRGRRNGGDGTGN